MIRENLKNHYLPSVYTLFLTLAVVLNLFMLYRAFKKEDNSRKTYVFNGLCMLFGSVLFLIYFYVFVNTQYFGRYFISMVNTLCGIFVGIYFLKK